jgi:hypothetical protein
LQADVIGIEIVAVEEVLNGITSKQEAVLFKLFCVLVLPGVLGCGLLLVIVSMIVGVWSVGGFHLL